MKPVGGDSGRCEREESVAEVVAPSERIRGLSCAADRGHPARGRTAARDDIDGIRQPRVLIRCCFATHSLQVYKDAAFGTIGSAD
jgi:hypothetical protein